MKNSWLKAIVLGIKDYIRDVRHDRLCGVVNDRYHQYVCEDVGEEEFEFAETYPWKEGSVWHYIEQRRLAK